MAATPSPRPQYRYAFHSVFAIYTFVTVLVAIGAFQANNNLLYWLFGLAIGLMLVSGLISGIMMVGLRVTRLAIEPGGGIAGQPLRVRYSVENRSRILPVMAVSIIEHLDTSPDPQHHQAALDVDPAMAGPKGLPQPMRAEILHVPARSEIVVEGVVRAAGRGVLRLRGYEVVTTFPFGIIKKHLWYDAPTSAIIQPASEPVDATIIDRRGGLSSSGDSGRVVGRQGEEFVGLREYAPGDSPKLVAWRASAALPPGELLVRQIATGTPKKVWVRLSLRRADSPDAAERAISQATAFLRLANVKRMQVGLSIWTDWGHVLDAPPGSHGGRAAALINDLALLPIGTEATTEHAIPAGVVARRGVADVIIDVSAEGWSRGASSGGRGGSGARAKHASPAEVTPA